MRLKRGRRGYMAVKIDLEKAYDRLKWNFVRDTLRDIGIPEPLVSIIWQCISSSNMRVLWNGEELESFLPTRGIRQGDPLSPYLFVLCMERLSHLISAAANEGRWKPFPFSKDGRLCPIFAL